MSSDSESDGTNLSDPAVIALKTALCDRDPFYSGTCAIADYQRLLYYIHHDLLRRIDLSIAGADDLEDLYRACTPAEFGRNGESVFDESYRKAGKMDLTSFSTLFDPHSLGIHEQVSKALLTESLSSVNMELYKLNVYGEGDFFKAHKDTPQSQEMFGSLVVILPTAHEGGQLVLRHGEKEWTVDFTDKFAAAKNPSVCFVAFYGDIEHEVMPVTSGYRVTLTYNLYHKPAHPTTSILAPFQLRLKQALLDLVNDKRKLPNGGYLGLGLVHEYVHTGHDLLQLLSGQLKGSDRALADVCDELGLRYSLRLFYRDVILSGINLVTTKELDIAERLYDEDLDYREPMSDEYLRYALKSLTIEQVEGIHLVGCPAQFTPKPKCKRKMVFEDPYGCSAWLRPFYRNPVTEVLEITPMKSSVGIKSLFMTYGNQEELDHFYGTACMLIAVGPATSRESAGE